MAIIVGRGTVEIKKILHYSLQGFCWKEYTIFRVMTNWGKKGRA